MAFVASVKIQGLKETQSTFVNIGKYIKKTRNTLKRAIKYMKETTEGQVFNTRGGSIGKKWASLSPAYRAWKASKYPGKGILQRTGKMRGNFKTKVSNTQAELSNPTKYFKYHQLGTRKMPQRVVLYVDDRREKKVIDMFSEDSEKILNKK